MRAIQRAIVGVGLALVAVVAMALLIGNPGPLGPDPSDQPATQATGPRIPLVDVPTGPPEPVDAAEDTAVGTLPPPPDASLASQLASRDLLAPSESAAETQRPADGRSLGARKARAAEKRGETSGRTPTMPQQDFTVAQDGWEWSEWDGTAAPYADDGRSYGGGSYGDRDGEDCRREHRYDHRYDRRDCDDRDRRD